MSIDLEVDELNLTFVGAAGQEHRAAEISRRAVALLEEVVNQNLAQLRLVGGGRRLREVKALDVKADLARSSDEQVARLVAQAMYSALVLQLRV